MTGSDVLSLVKARLGISADVRDSLITAIADGIITEVQDVHGLTMNKEDANHLMFIVDYTNYRYMNPDGTKAMPRHLQFRLHNMIIQKAGTPEGDASG